MRYHAMTGPLYVSPAVLQWVAANLDSIRENLASATAAAALPTTGMVPAAADEVSAAITSLFSRFGGEYQALAAEAEAFHDQFTRSMAAGGAAYAGAEASNAQQQLLDFFFGFPNAV